MYKLLQTFLGSFSIPSNDNNNSDTETTAAPIHHHCTGSNRMSSSTAAAKKPAEVVDLCVDDDDDAAAASSRSMNGNDDDGLLEVWGGATPLTTMAVAPRRKKRKPNPAALAAASVDAIDMTGSTTAASTAESSTPEERRFASYKEKLGPLRMEFLSGKDADDFLKTHSFAAKPSDKGKEQSSKVQTSKMRQLYRELAQYALDLPATPQGAIFVRAAESRLDLVRVLITGPEGTPYANGCFFFDFHLYDYPNSPPKGNFLTTGGSSVRFNPNLYNCGKICLSLLGTWEGPKWLPNKSTLLQVLISIQGLILVEEPFFNEPGYERNRDNSAKASEQYSRNIRKQTLKWAIEDPLRRSLDMLEGKETTVTPKIDATPYRYGKKPTTDSIKGYSEFAVVVVLHFAQKKEEIESQLLQWTSKNDSQAKTIRDLLQRAVKQSGDFQHAGNLKPAARETTGVAFSRRASSAKKAPSSSEVIEIL